MRLNSTEDQELIETYKDAPNELARAISGTE